MKKSHYIDQALIYFHSWISSVNRDTCVSEMVAMGNKLYPNLIQLKDSNGRTILHLLSSYGPEWAVDKLLTIKKLNFGIDLENGWNAAHRAAYFGNLLALRSLYVKNPALFDLTDRSRYTPIDMLVWQSKHKARIVNEGKTVAGILRTAGVLQTWGQNQNYTLGTESESARRFPDKIAIPLFDPVVHVSFSKYHGLCLTDMGKVHSWGVNQNGRLGYSGPVVELQPKQVIFENSHQQAVVVGHISTAENHSLYVSVCGRAYVSGSNQYRQLGLGVDVDYVNAPRMISPGGDKQTKKYISFKLCAAGSAHSVLATENSIYVAGRNIGQFGNELQSTFVHFAKVSATDNLGRIHKLVSSNAAIALFTVSQYETTGEAAPLLSGEIWLLENGETKKILKVKNVLEVSVCGGRVRNSEDVDWRATEPKVSVLTQAEVIVWSPAWRQGRRIKFLDPPPNFFPLGSVAFFEYGEKFLVAANDGQCYFAVSSKRRVRKWSNREIDYISKRSAEDPFSICGYLKKELNSTDQGNLNFQLERIPGASRCNAVFAETNGRTFGLITITSDEEDVQFSFLQAENELEPTTLNQDMYELYEYSVGCDLVINSTIDVHRDVVSSLWPDSCIQSTMDITEENDQIRLNVENCYLYNPLNGHDFDKDLVLKCMDGSIKCSSVVLIARSEYFKMMLSTNHWVECSERVVDLDLMVDEVQAMINFCCTNELPKSVELLSQLSIIADRLLIKSLSSQCQQQLGRMLAQEKCPKAALKAFPFALTYNTMYLARKCTQIIANYLPVLLETGYMDLLMDGDLEEMSKFYQEILDNNVVRMKPHIPELEFDNFDFTELCPVIKVRKEKNSILISPHSSKTDANVATNKQQPTSETKVIGRPIRKQKARSKPVKLELDKKETEKSPKATVGWLNEEKLETPSPMSSLKEIMENEQGATSADRKSKTFWPGRRKQARGQDIIRWEQQNIVELSKRCPSSPWGNAKPVNTQPVGEDKITPLKSPPRIESLEAKSPTSNTMQSPKSWSPVSLTEIMENEKRDEKMRMKCKSINVIEIEERAVTELTKFYKMQFPTDIITVTRIISDGTAK